MTDANQASIGWAYIDSEGFALAASVAPTMRGAKVNALHAAFQVTVTNDWSDDQINQNFAAQAKLAGGKVGKVRIVEIFNEH